MKTKYLVLFLSFIISTKISFGQKIRGVYFGEIISEKNALVILGETGEVTGEVLLNKSEKLPFNGTYKKPLLVGVIKQADGSELSLRGELNGNSLQLTLGGNERRVSRLRKISAKIDYDPKLLFSEDHNPLLFGKWEIFKIVSLQGKEIELKARNAYEFEGDGNAFWSVTYLSGLGSVPVSSMNPRQAMTWSTSDKEITIIHSDGGTFVEKYFIKGDTLIIEPIPGPREFYSRK